MQRLATAARPAAAPAVAPVAAAPCWERDYTDPAADGVPDVQPYSLSFSCSSSMFTFSFAAPNPPHFPTTLYDDVHLWIITGTGGCSGAGYLVAGAVLNSHAVGAVFRTPTCDEETWSLVREVPFVEHDMQSFSLAFSPADVAGALFNWWADVPIPVSNSKMDRFPDIGSHTSGGVPYHPTATSGYWLTDSEGGVHPYGNAPYFGDLRGHALAAPVVDMSANPARTGYWLLARDGGVFAYGSVGFYGSTGALHLNQPIEGMTPTASGHGYWFVASDGGIFSYGDAAFYGSTGALHLNRPIVAMTPTPSGHGYWLVASDGGIFAFGDAAFYGSTGALHLAKPIVAMTASPTGHGYRFVASDGGIFSYGDVPFWGSLAGTTSAPVVALDD